MFSNSRRTMLITYTYYVFFFLQLYRKNKIKTLKIHQLYPSHSEWHRIDILRSYACVNMHTHILSHTCTHTSGTFLMSSYSKHINNKEQATVAKQGRKRQLHFWGAQRGWIHSWFHDMSPANVNVLCIKSDRDLFYSDHQM